LQAGERLQVFTALFQRKTKPQAERSDEEAASGSGQETPPQELLIL